MADVLVVIPVHNALWLTLACLKSLISTGQPTSDVVVVDNGSTDGTADAIRRDFPNIHLVIQENLGYGAAANVGLKIALQMGYRYTWVLNNDTIVPNGTLAGLVAFMDRPENVRVGACSPLILSDEREARFSGGWLDRYRWLAGHVEDLAVGEARLVQFPASSFLTGAALFVRSSTIAEIGLFDETFFMYWEDVDLCIRLVEAGWQLRLVPSNQIFHERSGSSGSAQSPFIFYYATRNRFLLWRKHTHGLGKKTQSLLAILGSLAAWNVPSPKVRRVNERDQAILKALFDGIAGRFCRRRHLPTPFELRGLIWILWPTMYFFRQSRARLKRS